MTIAINKMLLMYKGSYCLFQQYMPNKPKKWGLKDWCLACPVLKNLWNFEIYYGNECLPPHVLLDPRGIPPSLPACTQCREAKVAHNLVVRLLKGLWHCSLAIVMDNNFLSIGLILDLLKQGQSWLTIWL